MPGKPEPGGVIKRLAMERIMKMAATIAALVEGVKRIV